MKFNLTLLTNLLFVISDIARSPLFKHRGDDVAQTVRLVGFLLVQKELLDADLIMLTQQLRTALNEHRPTLTDAESAYWHARHVENKAGIEEYFATHPNG